jgi:hypothetical protein
VNPFGRAQGLPLRNQARLFSRQVGRVIPAREEPKLVYLRASESLNLGYTSLERFRVSSVPQSPPLFKTRLARLGVKPRRAGLRTGLRATPKCAPRCKEEGDPTYLREVE